MHFDPTQPIPVKVELQINSVWTDITSRGRAVRAVRIKHAQSEGSIQPETSTCELVLGNDDGWLNEDDPRSPWTPGGRGTPIRVSLAALGEGGTDAYRFTGEIDRMDGAYLGGGNAVMLIEAIGTWGVLAETDEVLRSPMFRSTRGLLSGLLGGDFAPTVYLPLEDGTSATAAASGLPGGISVKPSGTVRFGAATSLAGSEPLPTFGAGARLAMSVPPYSVSATDIWAVQVLINVPTAPGSATTLVEMRTRGEGDNSRYRLVLEPGSPDQLTLYATDKTTLVESAYITQPLNGSNPSSNPTEADFYGSWRFYTIAEDDVVVPGALVAWLTISDGTGASGALAGSVGAPTTSSSLSSVTLFAEAATDGIAFGHLAAFIQNSPPFIPDEHLAVNARAMQGWSSETVKERIERLASEQGLSVSVVGGSSHQMGPQRSAKLVDLFTDCQDVDGGIWSDDRGGIGLVYRTGSHLYTQPARVAVQRGSLTPDTRPMWDYSGIRNEWTVSRIDGSSAVQSDEAHIALHRRRRKGSISLNVYSDDVLDNQARWRVHLGTAEGPRYPSLGIDMRNPDGARLDDSVLALVPGDRVTAASAAFPVQHPPGGMDQMVIGWTELIDVDEWKFYPVCVPYETYGAVGRWALLAHELHAAIDSSTTSIDIATTDATQPLLATTGLGSGYGVTIGGEELQITAVADSLVTYGAAGTTSHGNNASVTPGLPSGLAQGNLMLILAAIRNSGAGVPNAPSGYTRLAVFPATANVQIFAKIAGASESGPTVTFTGGVANADTSARMIRLAGKWHDVNNILVGSATRLNPSAQNIIYPGLPKPLCDNAIVIVAGWKQDDWTSVAQLSGMTEITEDSTTTGDDQGIVWDRVIQTTAASVPSGSFSVTGGASAISRSAIFALRCDYQTATATRSTNGISASHSAGDDVTMTKPMRWALT